MKEKRESGGGIQADIVVRSLTCRSSGVSEVLFCHTAASTHMHTQRHAQYAGWSHQGKRG